MKFKRVCGVGIAIAVMAPIGVLTAGPAAAAGGTTCKTQTGSATVKPGLLLTQKRDQTITATTAISGCSGGGVTKGTGTSTVKVKAANCAGLAKTGMKMTLTETIKWTATKISKLAGTSTTGPKAGQATIALTVKSGLFVGKKATTIVSFTPKKGEDCSAAHPIQHLTIKGVKPFVIK